MKELRNVLIHTTVKSSTVGTEDMTFERSYKCTYPSSYQCILYIPAQSAKKVDLSSLRGGGGGTMGIFL